MPGSTTLGYPIGVEFRTTPCDLEEVKSDWFREAFRQWEAARADLPMPSRADVNPLAIRAAIGKMAMIDVAREGGNLDFIFRLFGTEIVTAVGEDATGKSIDTIHPAAYGRMLRDAYEDVVRLGRPRCDTIIFRFRSHGRSYNRLILPLGANGRDVDRLWVLFEERRQFWETLEKLSMAEG